MLECHDLVLAGYPNLASTPSVIVIILLKSNDLSDTITRQQLWGHLTKKAHIMLHVSCWQFNCQSVETAPDFCQPNDWLLNAYNFYETFLIINNASVLHKNSSRSEKRRVTVKCKKLQWYHDYSGPLCFYSLHVCLIHQYCGHCYLWKFGNRSQNSCLNSFLSMNHCSPTMTKMQC